MDGDDVRGRSAASLSPLMRARSRPSIVRVAGSCAVLALVLLALLAAPAAGAPPDGPARFVPPAVGLTGAYGKLSTDLLGLVDDRFLLPNQTRGALVAALAQSGHYAPANRGHRAVGTPAVDLVEVYVRTDPGAGSTALRSFVHRISAEDAADGLVAAWVAPGRLLDLARLPSVREIRPVLRPRVRAGSVTSAGDLLLRAAELRHATGLSGAGIRVGVISDGVDHRRSAQTTGDLPPDPDLVVLRNAVGGDEGTAMLEIVHDIAPNASLVFHDCGWNVLEFNQAIDALADAGCRVIVDDIGWTDEPFFEDGVVASHAADAVSRRGVVYVSAAGNDAGLHYQAPFLDDNQGRHEHDFSNGTSAPDRLYVDLPPGESVTAILEWSEPFGSAASNYDLALYDTADPSVPLALSSRVQDGDDDPLEVVTWVNTGETTAHAEVDVSKSSSAPARTLELFVYPHGGAVLLPTNTVADDSIYGHPAASGVVAVGAIDSTDPIGTRIEPYSSRGPVTIAAPLAGTRQKPDCAGVDGVRVTGAGSFPTGFWGSSAAAPHAAGIAALVWSGRQDATGAEVRRALLGTADDLGTVTAYGSGRVNATAMHALLSTGLGEPKTIPGRIEAEDYDSGGEGVAYHDTTSGNEGGVYRLDDVDIEPMLGGHGYNVGWIRAGEWLEYTVNVTAGGPYTLSVRGASRWGDPSLSLLVDGSPAATVPIYAKASYDDFGLTNATVNLPAGEHRLRLALSGYFNLDYLEFRARSPVLRLPGAASDPRDLDGDGRYEDANGNGRRDFNDVVLYFTQMTWIAANEPVNAFDFNANGRCDFADVTTLFGVL